MLSVFPDFIYLGVAFAPFIIRMSVGLAVLSLALYHFRRQERGAVFFAEIAPALKPYAHTLVKVGPVISILIAICLFVGFLTQVAAIGSFLLSLKMVYFKKKFPRIAPESKNFYVLLAVLSFILILSGAGPFAFDIPL